MGGLPSLMKVPPAEYETLSFGDALCVIGCPLVPHVGHFLLPAYEFVTGQTVTVVALRNLPAGSEKGSRQNTSTAGC